MSHVARDMMEAKAFDFTGAQGESNPCFRRERERFHILNRRPWTFRQAGAARRTSFYPPCRPLGDRGVVPVAGDAVAG